MLDGAGAVPLSPCVEAPGFSPGDNPVILSEGAVYRPAPEPKDPYAARVAATVPGSSLCKGVASAAPFG